MKTLPDIPWNEHVDNLIQWLRKFFPDLGARQLLFFDAVKSGWLSVNRQDLLPQAEFGPFFIQLCEEGREWINLSGPTLMNGKPGLKIWCEV
jgi:hypothetical protein